MVKIRYSRFLYLGFLVVLGCSIDPIAKIDFHGLGDSVVGKKIANSIFLGADTTDRSIARLINTPDILSRSDPRPVLESMGFSCDSQERTMCYFDGTAKFLMSMPDGTNPISGIKRVHVSVNTSTKPFKVVAEIETTKQ